MFYPWGANDNEAGNMPSNYNLVNQVDPLCIEPSLKLSCSFVMAQILVFWFLAPWVGFEFIKKPLFQIGCVLLILFAAYLTLLCMKDFLKCLD